MAMQEPQVLYLKRRPVATGEYRLRRALESDYSTLVRQPTIIYDTEQEMVTVVYLHLEEDASQLVEVLKRVEYQTQDRTNGMRTTSRVFGYQPRIPLRRDYCTTTALARESPEAHALITSYAERVSRLYQRYNPELYAQHQAEVSKVLPEWTLEESVFTSGIINKNNPLLYHFDTGNFRNVWSNMLGFKRNVGGGYLAMPEYDLALEIADNTLSMFDGQNLLHGVTPIRLLSEDAHRFTVVFYSLKQMWKCLPPKEEVRRIQRVRTEKELARLERQRKGEALMNDGSIRLADGRYRLKDGSIVAENPRATKKPRYAREREARLAAAAPLPEDGAPEPTPSPPPPPPHPSAGSGASVLGRPPAGGKRVQVHRGGAHAPR